MRLADEVRAQLNAFVDGSLSAHELAGWLDSVAPELHAPGAENPRRLVGQVYVVLSELGYGDRTAESARAEVAEVLSDVDTIHVHETGQSAGIKTASSSL